MLANGASHRRLELANFCDSCHDSCLGEPREIRLERDSRRNVDLEMTRRALREQHVQQPQKTEIN